MADGGKTPEILAPVTREAQALADDLATYEWLIAQTAIVGGRLSARIDDAARAGNAEGLDIRACEQGPLHRLVRKANSLLGRALEKACYLHCRLIGEAVRLGIHLPPPRITPPELPVETKTGGR